MTVRELSASLAVQMLLPNMCRIILQSILLGSFRMLSGESGWEVRLDGAACLGLWRSANLPFLRGLCNYVRFNSFSLKEEFKHMNLLDRMGRSRSKLM